MISALDDYTLAARKVDNALWLISQELIDSHSCARTVNESVVVTH